MLREYLRVIPRIAAFQGALEPSVVQMHSLAVVARLLPAGVSIMAWGMATAGVSWLAVRVWPSAAPMYARTAALVLGSVLVNPHVNLYDAAVLASPLVSLSGWSTFDIVGAWLCMHCLHYYCFQRRESSAFNSRPSCFSF